MKEFIKKILNGKVTALVAISVALIVFGGIISFIGFAAMGFNPARVYMSGEEYAAIYETTEQTFLIEKHNLNTIDLNISTGDIEIVKGIGPDIKIKLSMRKYNSQIVDNSLRITENEFPITEYKWYRIFNVNSTPSLKIKIEVPTSFQGDINVKNLYGDLIVKDIMGINNLSVESNSGKMTLANISTKGNVNINSKYGDIAITKSIVEGYTSVEKNSGSFKTEELTCSDLVVDSKYGDNKFSNTKMKSLDVESNSGNITISRVDIEQQFSCDSKYGNLVMENIASPIFKLKSQSGNIMGSINGDKLEYRINAITESGNNNLKISYEGTKELEVNSKYGNIDIEFEGN